MDKDNRPGQNRASPARGENDGRKMFGICLAASASSHCGRAWMASPLNRAVPADSGGIAQLAERQLCKLEVAGSNPAASTNATGRVAQLVRARP